MTKRNYQREHMLYYGRPGRPSTWTALQRKHRRQKVARNKARQKMTVKHGTRIRNKDIHHKNGNPEDNRMSNLAIVSVNKNRSHKPKKRKKM